MARRSFAGATTIGTPLGEPIVRFWDLDGGFVGAVRLERDQLDGVDIERRAQDAGLGLLRHCEGGNQRGRIVL
jgi:hypothetical protein